jgi:Rrf2 family iron-sulfur cluster assembly transcriptional regulator
VAQCIAASHPHSTSPLLGLKGETPVRISIEWDMLKLPRRSVVAIEAMVHVGLTGAGRAIPTIEISEAIDVPKRGLEPILQQLVRAELLASTRGPQGGYSLARERAKISIAAIVEAALDTETAASDNRVSKYGNALAKFEEKAERHLRAALSEYSLDDLCDAARKSGVKVATSKSLDYSI